MHTPTPQLNEAVFGVATHASAPIEPLADGGRRDHIGEDLGGGGCQGLEGEDQGGGGTPHARKPLRYA